MVDTEILVVRPQGLVSQPMAVLGLVVVAFFLMLYVGCLVSSLKNVANI
jgi:hypothetical protein